MADRKITKMTSPKGTFKWPKLTEPDYGTNQYPNPDGAYSVKVIFNESDPAFQAFRVKIEKAHAAAVELGEAAFKELKVETRKKLKAITVNEPFTVIYDQETEEPTGEVEMKISMKASGTVKKGPRAGKKWTRKPQLFDAKGKPMLKVPDIWGGTTGKVSFSFVSDGYFIPGTGACGISFQLEAAQIIDLVSGGQRQAGDYGFGEEEGYEHDDKAAADDEGDDGDEFEDETGGAAGADPEGAADF
jgi:hypothetical protein